MFQSHVRLSTKPPGCFEKSRFRKIPGFDLRAAVGFKGGRGFLRHQALGTGKGRRKVAKTISRLIVSDVPAAVAGMFTTNQVCAAPVKVSAKTRQEESARAIVVNSGNANACTGRRD